MFTIRQIQLADAKVKSGADFPYYLREIRALGVIAFETFVRDNHSRYYGVGNYALSSEGTTETIAIANKCNTAQFQLDLKSHQLGHTNYEIFLKDCARSGIEKWVVEVNSMTCSYYDKAGNEVLVEVIPAV